MVTPSLAPAAPELTKLAPQEAPAFSTYGMFVKATVPMGDVTPPPPSSLESDE
jgi:hypothetical protein